MTNSEKYPKAWRFFVELARNMEGTIYEEFGKYRVPSPNKERQFIYAEDTPELFIKLKNEFYKENINSLSLYGKIQYIVNNL